MSHISIQPNDLKEGTVHPVIAAMGADAIAAYDTLLTSSTHAASTLDAYRKRIRAFLNWLEEQDLNLDRITEKDIKDYFCELESRGKKTSTIQQTAGALSFLIKHLTSNGITLATLPVTYKKPVHKTKTDPFTQSELTRFFAAIGGDSGKMDKDRALFLCMFAFAANPDEIRTLNVQDYKTNDEGQKTLTLSGTSSTTKQHIVIVPTEVQGALEKHLARAKSDTGSIFFDTRKNKSTDAPISSRQVRRTFKKHAKRAQLDGEKHLSPLSLKITALLMSYEDAANEKDGIERVRQLGRFVATSGHIAFLNRYRDDNGNLPDLSK